MTNDEMLRLVSSRQRSRVMWRKIGIFTLRFVPVVSLHFIILVCVARLLYYALRGVVHYPTLANASGVDHAFLTAFCLVIFCWMAYLLAASLYMGFCRIHRVVIVYDILGYLCIHIGRLVGYGRALPYIMVILAAYGLYLGTMVHIKINALRHDKQRTNFNP